MGTYAFPLFSIKVLYPFQYRVLLKVWSETIFSWAFDVVWLNDAAQTESECSWWLWLIDPGQINMLSHLLIKEKAQKSNILHTISSKLCKSWRISTHALKSCHLGVYLYCITLISLFQFPFWLLVLLLVTSIISLLKGCFQREDIKITIKVINTKKKNNIPWYKRRLEKLFWNMDKRSLDMWKNIFIWNFDSSFGIWDYLSSFQELSTVRD